MVNSYEYQRERGIEHKHACIANAFLEKVFFFTPWFIQLVLVKYLYNKCDDDGNLNIKFLKEVTIDCCDDCYILTFPNVAESHYSYEHFIARSLKIQYSSDYRDSIDNPINIW